MCRNERKVSWISPADTSSSYDLEDDVKVKSLEIIVLKLVRNVNLRVKTLQFSESSKEADVKLDPKN